MLLLASCGGGGGSGGGGIGEGNVTITMTANPGSISADGVSSTIISITVNESSGGPALPGTEIRLKTNKGSFSNGRSSYTYTLVTTTGQYNASLVADQTAGTAKVTATVDNVTQSIEIFFTAVPVDPEVNDPVAEAFAFVPDWLNISGLVELGIQDTLTAFAADILGNPINDGFTIDFRTFNTGGFINPETTQTSGGTASTVLTTSAPAPQQGFMSATALIEGAPTTRVSVIEVSPPPNTDIIFAGTAGGGVYKSVNGGQTWENVSRSSLNPRQGQNFIDPYVKGHSGICVDPDDPNQVYVGTGFLGDGNLYRSLDGGLNWNSNNVEQWEGLNPYRGGTRATQPTGRAAVLSVLCDGDSDPLTDYPYVWLGTEGRGFLYSTDGVNFQPSGAIITSGPTAGAGNVGNGFMSTPILWYTSQTETWTATANVITALATVPEADSSNAGNGFMSNVTTSATTVTESWTVEYFIDISTVSTGGSNVGNGTVFDIGLTQAPNSGTETWTLTCIDDTTPGAEVFQVVSNVAGLYPNATVGTSYSQDPISFTIIPGTTNFAVDDVLTFSTVGRWRVTGTVSGVQNATARNSTTYTSDNGEVSFRISQGTIPFNEEDSFTFATTEGGTVWQVAGNVSGLQTGVALNNTFYESDQGEVAFTIFEGSTPYRDGDSFTFTVQSDDVNHGRVVWDIKRVANTHGPNAILYAATGGGVYKSMQGGRIWAETTNFVGDFVLALELYPTATGGNRDVVYAATQDSGFWYSTDSGRTWIADSNGIDNSTGAIMIRDLVVDSANNYIYALVFVGPSDKAVPAVYVRDLNTNGSLAAGQWRKAQSGLGQTINAQWAITADNPNNPSALYIGGEGISLSKAQSGLTSGNPQWVSSRNGITNTIMARTPVLFSGCVDIELRIDPVAVDTLTNAVTYRFKVYVQDRNGNPPIGGSEFKAEFQPQSGSAFTFFDIVYQDALVGQGTFRDPNNPFTDWAYEFTVSPSAGDAVELTFRGADTLPDPPGNNCVDEEILTIVF
jgi:hypothetical protein